MIDEVSFSKRVKRNDKINSDGTLKGVHTDISVLKSLEDECMKEERKCFI